MKKYQTLSLLSVLLFSLFNFINAQNLPKNREMDLEYTEKLGLLVLKKNLKPAQKATTIINNRKILIDYYYFETTKGSFLLCIFDQPIPLVATENNTITTYSRFFCSEKDGEEIKNYLVVKEAYEILLKQK